MKKTENPCAKTVSVVGFQPPTERQQQRGGYHVADDGQSIGRIGLLVHAGKILRAGRPAQ